ncbi:acetylornithine aminotransferase [Agromyces flavus]|uniref:Acetylornithine aminotransferase n=1 Tax=Agromyces flavus TaxID=589382 RepID=A0A1H1SUV2_9MICO|nr:acetylornithine aminotransferase [Agromyces flavus]GGI48733.1 acetylornithine aminotransferase [Agromyces flavus]SDS51613.1 acetylornithine aminotransferase apoenzyme [Agromyces flavus]
MTGWRERFEHRMMRTLGMPLRKLERGEGAWVWDDEGTRYLDFLAGIAVNSLGHAHPVFVEAVSRQAATLAHVSNYFATEPALELADRLARLTGAGEAGRVWFGNSGAEANEAAFKLARLNNSGGARSRVLALVDAFHGRTMGSLALTGKPAMREAFEPLPGGVHHIPSSIDALEAELDDGVAALIVEPIKGEAGVLDLPEGYLQAARELTHRHGALLIVDEIQTGAGRTGEWFAYQHAGILPDAITVAKGIGGGFPIGALVTFGHASELYSKGQHGSTFGGNPLATTVSNAVLGEIERAGLVENAARRGAELRERVLGLGSPLVAGVRGRGLLLGVALTEPAAAAVSASALDAGLIVNAANDATIRIAPPLNVGDAELDEFEARFSRALGAVAVATH